MEAFGNMAARMASRRGSEEEDADDPGFDWTTPVETTIPITVGRALDAHDLVGEILLSRALDVSEAPEDEVVVVVAHGPSSEEDNELWLGNMGILVETMRGRTDFSRIEHLTVRDDASESVRGQATEELRAVVEGAVDEGKSVLIVPLLLSYGGIETGIRERLEGLPYQLARQAPAAGRTLVRVGAVAGGRAIAAPGRRMVARDAPLSGRCPVPTPGRPRAAAAARPRQGGAPRAQERALDCRRDLGEWSGRPARARARGAGAAGRQSFSPRQAL